MKTYIFFIVIISLFIQLIICQSSYTQNIRYEIIQGDTISILTFPRHDKIKVEVISKVNSLSNGKFIYSYKLKSLLSSQQPVFDFQIITPYEVKNIRFPIGWFAITPAAIQGVSWGVSDSLHFLMPGNSIDGFSYASKRLPSITKYFVRGWAPIPRVRVVPDSTENNSILEDSKKGFGLGPGILPAEIEPRIYIDSLSLYLNQSCNKLGWVTNRGICRSLEAKLDNVSKQLGKDKIKQAVNGLTAFLHEVTAQRDKHITSEGYALLYFNAQYLKEQLEKQLSGQRGNKGKKKKKKR